MSGFALDCCDFKSHFHEIWKSGHYSPEKTTQNGTWHVKYFKSLVLFSKSFSIRGLTVNANPECVFVFPDSTSTTAVGSGGWLLHVSYLGADSMCRCCLTSIGIPIIKIRSSWDHLIFIMGIPVSRMMIFTLKQGHASGREFEPLFTRGQFWPSGIVVACVCVCVHVCVSVCLCVNHDFVHVITLHPFKLESPNLEHRCKTPWLRSLLFCGVIDLDLHGQI